MMTLESAVLALAEEMLQTSPFGLRITKEAYNMNIDAPSLESAINLENRQQSLLNHTQDFKEGALARYEKRKPNYRDR
jgi:enoyl-CoA hydratase/carnithine racemase